MRARFAPAALVAVCLLHAGLADAENEEALTIRVVDVGAGLCCVARIPPAAAADRWHTVVYGVILAVYSIPLRQGLMQYGELTLRGFVQAAGRSLRLDAAQRARWLEQSSRELARATEAVITRPPRAI